MSPVQNTQQKAFDPGYISTGSIIILLIHYYVVCHACFASPGAGPFAKVLERLQEVFQRLPFTGDENISKASALVLLIFSYLIPGGKPRKALSYVYPTAGLIAGLLLYFGSWRLVPAGTDRTDAEVYMV